MLRFQEEKKNYRETAFCEFVCVKTLKFDENFNPPLKNTKQKSQTLGMKNLGNSLRYY